MLKFRLKQTLSRVDAYFDDEPPARERLLSGFLNDMYDEEDLYLAEIAKAEAGNSDVIGNHSVWAIMSPDKVILEKMLYGDDQTNGTVPERTELTLQEAKQLILDWVEAKRRWFEEKRWREAN